MMPNAISPMNSRKRDHDDEIQTINRSLKSARLDSSDNMAMLVSQANVMQPILAPNTVNAYAPTSSYPFYQTMNAIEAPPMSLSMPSQLLPNDGQAPLMPAGLLTSLPHTLSHETLTNVFDGSELTLNTEQSSSPYFSNTSPIEESSLVSPTIQRSLDGYPTPGDFNHILDEYVEFP